MASIHNIHFASERKRVSVIARDDVPRPVPALESKAARRARLCPTPHLTVDQFVGLLACIEAEGGIATLDEISRALPAVSQPISAVLDLCDAEILNADLEAVFDGDMRVWRVDR